MDNKKLTIQELDFVQQEVKSKGKNMLTAYALTMLLPPVGASRAYLGKMKSGVIKTALSIANIISFKTILTATQANLSVEAIAESVNLNTALAIIFLGLTSANLIFFLAELLLIPKWVNKWNLKIEEEAITKSIESRYVAEKLMNDEITNHLMTEVKKNVLSKFQDEISILVSELEEKLDNKISKVSINDNYSVVMPTLPTEKTISESVILDLELPYDNNIDENEGVKVFDEEIDIDSINPGDIKDEYTDIQEIPEDFANLIKLEFIDDDDFAPIVNPVSDFKLTEEEMKIKEARIQFKKDQQAFSEKIAKIEEEEKLKELEAIKQGIIPSEEQVEFILEEIVDESGIYNNIENISPHNNLFDYENKPPLDPSLKLLAMKTQSEPLTEKQIIMKNKLNILNDDENCELLSKNENNNSITKIENDKKISDFLNNDEDLNSANNFKNEDYDKSLNVNIEEILNAKKAKRNKRNKRNKKTRKIKTNKQNNKNK